MHRLSLARRVVSMSNSPSEVRDNPTTSCCMDLRSSNPAGVSRHRGWGSGQRSSESGRANLWFSRKAAPVKEICMVVLTGPDGIAQEEQKFAVALNKFEDSTVLLVYV